MIRQWGAVLMAAAGLTIGAGAPLAAAASPGAQVGRHNQKITFARNRSASGDVIRATARGRVAGFGSAEVLDFQSDPRSGSFRGVWNLSFPAGTIRYHFSGVTRDEPEGIALPAGATGLALPPGVDSAGLARPASELDALGPDALSRARVAGEFTLVAGTGRFSEVAGRGVFHGWTLPESVTGSREITA